MGQNCIQGFSKLIGIPYEKMDCWAIVSEFYRIHFNTILPSPYASIPATRSEANEVLKENRNRYSEIKKEEAKFGDIITLKLFSIECHVAIFLGEGKMLHTSKGTGCIIERIAKWERVITGYYRFL